MTTNESMQESGVDKKEIPSYKKIPSQWKFAFYKPQAMKLIIEKMNTISNARTLFKL